MNPSDPYNQHNPYAAPQPPVNTPPAPPQPMTVPAPPPTPAPYGTPQPLPQPPAVPQPPVQPFASPTPPAPQPMVFGAPAQSPAPAPLAPNPYASPYPSAYPLPADSGSNLKKVIIIVVIMLVVLGAIVGTVVLLAGKHGGSGNPVANAVKAATGGASKDVIDRPDGTLDLSTLIDEQATIKNQTIQAKLNQQINQSDGLSYMVTAVHRNYAATSDYIKPAAGKELVKLDLVVGNRQQSGTLYVTSSMFQARNSAGGLQDTKYATTDDEADALDSAEVQPGKQTKGSIFFEVDQNEPITLVSINKYKNADSAQEATVESDVSLQ